MLSTGRSGDKVRTDQRRSISIESMRNAEAKSLTGHLLHNSTEVSDGITRVQYAPVT